MMDIYVPMITFSMGLCRMAESVIGLQNLGSLVLVALVALVGIWTEFVAAHGG